MKRPIPIHPLDLGLMLLLDPDLGDVFISPEGIKYKGSLYTQTVVEPSYKTTQRIKFLTEYLALAKKMPVGTE